MTSPLSLSRLSPGFISMISRAVLLLSVLALLGSIGLLTVAIAPAVMGKPEVSRRATSPTGPQATLASLIDRQAREAAGSSGAVLSVIAARIDAAVAAMEAAAHEPIGLLDGPRGEMLVGSALLALLAMIGGTVALALHLLPRMQRDDFEAQQHLAVLSATVSEQLAACSELIDVMRSDTMAAMEQLGQASARLRANSTEIEQRVMSAVTRAIGQAQPAVQGGAPGDASAQAARLSLAAAERTARHVERLERAVVELVQSLSRREDENRGEEDRDGAEGASQMVEKLMAAAARLEAAGDGVVRDAQILPAITGRLSQIQATLESAAIRLEEDVQRAGERQAAALENVHDRLSREVGGLNQLIESADGSVAERLEQRLASGLDQGMRNLSQGLTGAVGKAQMLTESMASLPVFLEQAQSALVDFTLDWTQRCENVLARLEVHGEDIGTAANPAAAIAAIEAAGQAVLRQMEAAMARIAAHATSLSGTEAGLAEIAEHLAASQERARLAGERSEAVVTRLETVTEPGEDKVAAAIAQIEAAGLESVSRLQETARRLDEHAAALAGVDRGLDQLAASLAVNVAQANEVSGRSAQVVDALGRLPALFDQSHEAMADWAGRCDALLARLEAEAAPVVEEKVENRSVASRLLADLARGA